MSIKLLFGLVVAGVLSGFRGLSTEGTTRHVVDRILLANGFRMFECHIPLREGAFAEGANPYGMMEAHADEKLNRRSMGYRVV